MKCDELKAYNVVATADVNPEVVDSLGCTEWTGYDKNEVDDAIAELKDENRKLRRALYKSCANWAKSERYTEATWHGDEHREELWANVQAKCLKKAEEYK